MLQLGKALPFLGCNEGLQIRITYSIVVYLNKDSIIKGVHIEQYIGS